MDVRANVASFKHYFVLLQLVKMYLPKDTAQDRGLNACTEKRDTVLSAFVEEEGKLTQDEDIVVSDMVEMLGEHSRGLYVGRTAEMEQRVCLL